MYVYTKASVEGRQVGSRKGINKIQLDQWNQVWEKLVQVKRDKEATAEKRDGLAPEH